MLQAIVHAADIQDRDGGAMLLATLFGLYPFLLKLYADGGYQGPEFRKALAAIFAQIEVEIVKRSDKPKALWCCPGDGWWNERLPGSAAVEDWPRIGSASTRRRGRSC